jgi:hypothetical protein
MSSFKTIDEELKKIAKALEKKGKGKAKTDPELDPKTLTSVLNSMLITMAEIVTHLKNEKPCPQVAKIAQSTRQLEDQADDHEQKNLMGKLIICSRPNDANETCIMEKEELEERGQTIKQHAAALAKEKLGVEVKEEEILRAYHLPNKNLAIHLDPIYSDNSALTKVVTAIKSPTQHNRKMNCFFNFQLTRRRSQLLWQVRQFKKAGKIARYWTDSDGSITIRQEEGEGGHKEKITSYKKGKSFSATLATITVSELKERFT